MDRQQAVKTALGEIKPELVLKNANVVNVFTGEVVCADVAVSQGIIAGVGKYSGVKETD